MADFDDPQVKIPRPAVAVASREGEPTVFLMLPGVSGEPVTLPVQRAGKRAALRFAVGEPGRRGTIWRLWANRDVDDVYLATRPKAGEFKISLHASGDWRAQLIAPDKAKTVAVASFDGPLEGRIVDQWVRPVANAVGWTHGVSIVLPEHHLVEIPGDPEKWEDVRWLKAPGPGEHVEFAVFLVRPGQGLMSYEGLLLEGGSLALVDALLLAGGEVVVVLAYRVRTSPDEAEAIRRYEELSRPLLPEADFFDSAPELGPRVMGMGHGDDGERRYYDLSYERVNS